MKVNSNIQAMIANNVLKRNENAFSKSTEKMSSGYKINTAKDSPSGMAITNRMSAQIRSLNKANQNASNAENVIQTAEGALAEIQDMVQRMNELAARAANGTNTTSDREAIQAEVKQLKKEIERIATQTEYNTQSLLNGEQSLRGYVDNITGVSAEYSQGDKAVVKVGGYDEDFQIEHDYTLKFTKNGEGDLTFDTSDAKSIVKDTDEYSYKDGVLTITNSKGGEILINIDEEHIADGASVSADIDLKGIGGMTIQVGSREGQEIRVEIPDISLKNMGIDKTDMTTEEGARKALDQVQTALSYISNVRSKLGAYQNRLETTISNLDVSVENITQSYSTIKDVDMAEEMVEYTKLQVLVQAGTSMLTQANEQPQQALQLLQ